MKKHSFIAILLVAALLLVGGGVAHALTASTTYTITVYKMNSNGTLTSVSSTTATTDSSGKLSFSLSNMPTNSECNFMVFQITDGSGVVQRKGFAPAPPTGSTNLVGVNNLSTAQTNAIIAAAEALGSDDPIAAAFLLILLRSDAATTMDATTLAALGRDAITGTGGFEDFLLTNGVTAGQFALMKSYLIYNPTSGKKTIADLAASFKAAVDAVDSSTAKQEMQKAGGFMADVFMDAASGAGIDFGLIRAAHDAAGVVAQSATNQARMASLSATVKTGIEQAMSSFQMRIAAIQVKDEYTKALNALGATGTQVDTFLTAVSTMLTEMGTIDSDYANFWSDPDAYIASQGTTKAAVQAAIDARYQTAFSNFQTNIQTSDADKTAMKTAVVTAMKVQDPSFVARYLPSDFGTYRDFSGTTKNWPIPQTVMVNWIASIISAGGSLTYTRDSTSVPAGMSWLGTCGNPMYWDAASCVGNGSAWTPGRRSYTPGQYGTPSTAFNAYLGTMEDLQIIEFSRYAIYQSGSPTREQEKEARLLFEQRIQNVAESLISGTTDGSTAISDAQKKGIVESLMQPSMN